MQTSGKFAPFAAKLIIMPVQPESLEILDKADVPPAQARAIVRAIEIEIAGAKDTLATKHDLLLLRHELRGEMGALRDELRGEMGALRHELRGEMGGLREALHRETAALRHEMAVLRGELRAEVHATASSTNRQMYMALLGQMAVLLGAAYFFVTHVAA